MSASNSSHSRLPRQALVVGTAALRGGAVESARAMGLTIVESEDPYSAMAELARDPGRFHAVILSLQSLYREELQIIPSIKLSIPAVEIWLTDAEGRSAALAQAMRLGAEGLLGEEGIHRAASGNGTDASTATQGSGTVHVKPVPVPAKPADDRPVALARPPIRDESVAAVPIRTAERLQNRAVLEEEDPYNSSPGEPVLTADELRALLHDPS